MACSSVAFVLGVLMESGIPSARLFFSLLIFCFTISLLIATPVQIGLRKTIESTILRNVVAGASCGLVPAAVAMAAIFQGGTLMANNEILSSNGAPTLAGWVGVLQYLVAFSTAGACAGAIYSLSVCGLKKMG